MKVRRIAAAMALCLLPVQAAAQKTAGNITVLGDTLEYSAAVSTRAAGDVYAIDGGLSAVANEIASGVAGEVLESGFYSRLVAGPAGFDYAPQGSSSFTATWSASNPAGTTYDLFVSSWAQADPYMVYYSTDASGYPVETLAPNTSYYNFAIANYMEGDYSSPASTTAVTLAVMPSTGAFTLLDAGHDTLAVSFTDFANSPPLPAGPWQTAAGDDLPKALYGHSSVISGTHVYVTGGFDGVYFSSAVYRAHIGPDGSLGAWQTAGFMPAGLYGHGAVAARGRLYILGGYSSSGSRSEVWSADISSVAALGQWESETALPDAMYFHATALVGDKIYVSGGYKSGSGVLSGLSYAPLGLDGALGAWDTSNTIPAPRYAHSMTLLPGRLLLAGGKDGASARTEVWSIPLDDSFVSGAASAYTALPSPRYGHAAVAAGSRLYVIGGNNGNTPQQNVFHSSVPASGMSQWEGGEPLASVLQFASPQVTGNRIYLFGGSSGASAVSEFYYADLRGTEYFVEASADPAFTPPLFSSWNSEPSARFADLTPLTTYYFRAKARNWTGVETAYSPAASTVTYAAIPGTAAWTSVGITTADANWLPNGNPAGIQYQIEVSTSPDYSNGGSSYVTSTLLNAGGLDQSTTYYARVRVYDPAAGYLSRFIDLPPVKTSFDPALDVDSPTVTNNQSGDFAYWIGTNTFLCDVDFTDVGASEISRFQLQVSTALGDPASAVSGWIDAVTGINQPSYSADWALPQQVWEAMLDGASNYVSVRVYDNSTNYTEQRDLFSVLKDSTPPTIGVPYAALAPVAWQTDWPGKVTDLSFGDPLSGLSKVQYSVSTDKSFADGAVIPWTDITLLNSTAALTVGATWYQTDLTYSFNALANATSNYFSFRAMDVAGSTYTALSAFGIAKNVSGPTILISTPTGLFLSTFTEVAGNTAETNAHPVQGSEVSLRDLSTNLYYNGASFISGSQYWHDASDAASTFTITFNNLPLISGRQYQAVARSSDSAGDYSQLLATHTFTFDTTPPSAGIVYPASGSTEGTVRRISGTASDAAAGIASVEAALRRLSDGKWWKNTTSSWDAAPEPLLSGTTPYWTWNFQPYLRDSLVHGASYYATVRAADAALPANSGQFYAAGSTFTYIDDTPPPATLTLSAAQGSYTGAVELVWRASGDNGYTGYLLSGTYKVAHSTYPGAAVSTATAQITITTATITAGATQARVINSLDTSATHYFTLWTADDAGNWSPASSEVSALPGAPGSGALTGSVMDASTQPVTGVLVEAIGPTGAVEGSDYTDAFGAYSISGLDSLYLTVRAVWAADDIESSVSKDTVPNGSSGVNFRLSVTYQLASITGIIPSNYLPSVSVVRPAGKRYTTREASSVRGADPFVEVYSRGRRIGAAYTDAAGAFRVENLLPGTYSLRVFNGAEFSKMETVRLGPGQQLVFSPSWTLLDKSGVYAYPNPANTSVNFRFAPAAVSFTAEVQVFDVAGRLVKRLDNVSADSMAGGNKITWDLARDNVASGVYLYILRVRDDSTGTSEKVIKKFAVIR